jgi:glycerol-3-phosphate O-acyltransferase/dihydroxyacetone phosphate acyltransferase
MPGFGIAHSILIRIASFAVDSFFHEIKIVGGENVPTEGGVVL